MSTGKPQLQMPGGAVGGDKAVFRHIDIKVYHFSQAFWRSWKEFFIKWKTVKMSYFYEYKWILIWINVFQSAD